MNKKLSEIPSDMFHEEKEWSDHPLVEWFSSHKNTFLWSVLVFIVALIVFAKVISWRNLDAEKDYIQAEEAFAKFQQESLIPSESDAALKNLNILESVMAKRADLKPKYQGSIAETLLILSDGARAEGLVNDIFKRTSPDHLKFYQDFTKGSLYIAKKEFAKAIEECVKLQTVLDLLDKSAVPATLYVFNLVRLGLLYEQSQNSAEELKVWDILKAHPEQISSAFSASNQLLPSLSSLNQYVDERRNSLMNASY